MIYKVETRQDGRWWAISVTQGLPANMLGVSQAKRLNQVEQVAKDLIADLLETDATTIEIDLTIHHPKPLIKLLSSIEKTATKEETARLEGIAAKRLAAQTFLKKGYTLRETGTALGLSHQRIKQLVDS